jgi:hypothetical protein
MVEMEFGDSEWYCNKTMKDETQSISDSENDPRDLGSLAEGARRKYLYRKLVINGRAKIPARLAMKMVGPDCAFHLYRNHSPGDAD